ncbi:YciI family protein [Longimicrobium terrae]|uniref:YCII-related domain-containing protein n=1 Tax=Longimicrobium terrae TaxID=1639882 RepID=A0A841GP79_9BACT|nr:YciI family protein [Longimicrobium terrae]MBB4634747.1 hypothetical protein [Longimicrobium terrae]MBB6069142.1 hypothetical protein [Longimicrobium terrae]NNC32041.1 YciI family protein [Longimicrobium terrae]
MRFMLMIYPDATAEDGAMPDAAAVAEMMKYNEELASAGVLLALDGLHPTSEGARIYFEEGRARVVDGPFSEAREVVGGYWLLQVKSKEEAVEWARRCPAGTARFLELRRVFDMADFPADVQEAGDSALVRETVEKHAAPPQG